MFTAFCKIGLVTIGYFQNFDDQTALALYRECESAAVCPQTRGTMSK